MRVVYNIAAITVLGLICLLGCKNNKATAPIPMLVNFYYQGQPISFTNNEPFTCNNDLTIETLKLYVTNVRLMHQNKVVFQEANSYHLLNAANSLSLNFNLQAASKINFDRISFSIGVDSLTNIAGAMGGALDPMHGMYWTWQSGYINFKLEGKVKNLKTHNNQFQYHIGGYQAPFNTLQNVTLDVQNNNQIKMAIDIARLFQTIDLQNNHHIMRPNDKAVAFAKLLPNLFSIVE